MVNQLGKFSPHIADLTQPLRELLSTKRAWLALWGPEQESAFNKIKEELVQPTVLTLYDPHAAVKVSANASSSGLGAVLLQQAKDGWKPVAYTSRSTTETERRYAQIEKESLAITWACSKFSDYILGQKFLVETSQATYSAAKHKALGQSTTTHSTCLLYTSPSPRDATLSRMPSSA